MPGTELTYTNVDRATPPQELLCSGFLMASHPMKTPAHSFCADFNTRGDVDFCSYCVSKVLDSFYGHLMALLCNTA